MCNNTRFKEQQSKAHTRVCVCVFQRKSVSIDYNDRVGVFHTSLFCNTVTLSLCVCAHTVTIFTLQVSPIDSTIVTKTKTLFLSLTGNTVRSSSFIFLETHCSIKINRINYSIQHGFSKCIQELSQIYFLEIPGSFRNCGYFYCQSFYV